MRVQSARCRVAKDRVHSEVRRQSRAGQAALWFTKQAQPSECSKLFIHVDGTNKNDEFQSHKCNKPHRITEKIIRLSDVSTNAQMARRLLCCRFFGGSIKLYLHLRVTVYCLIFFPGLTMLCQVNIAMNYIPFQSQSSKKILLNNNPTHFPWLDAVPVYQIHTQSCVRQ